MSKVSVIVPNYNHALYLRQRIQSILDQTFQDFNLTYLDDASTDNSNAVFTELVGEISLKEDRKAHIINAIYNESNSGSPFKQWNKGVRATQGEYIWIAESDDIADPNFLATMVPILDNHPNVGLAYAQSCRIDSNNKVLEPTLRRWVEDLDSDRWHEDFVASGIVECKKYLIFKNTIPNASAVLIRRSVYEAIGGAEESLFLTGDWMTWIEILLKSDIAFSARTLNSFRSHKSSVSSRSYLNGTETYEYMSIRQFLADNLQIPSATILKLKEQSIADWIKLTFAPNNTLNFQKHLDFYQLARKNAATIEIIIFSQFYSYILSQLKMKVKLFLPDSLKNA